MVGLRYYYYEVKVPAIRTENASNSFFSSSLRALSNIGDGDRRPLLDDCSYFLSLSLFQILSLI